ncbi:hypothetical protein ANO11243_042330 [Dothideomycetidae sp. 11243]|nr:hypothetical protein ANO11243_042330 [fungal sp. No.11243]
MDKILPVLVEILAESSVPWPNWEHGTLDVCLGIEMLGGTAQFPAASPVTAITDSQVRFLGSAWAGWGVMLWWASNDVRGRQTPLALLGGVIFAGGIGRALSARRFGFGAQWIPVVMWVELLGPGAL